MGKRRRQSVSSNSAANNAGRGSGRTTTVVTREEKRSAQEVLWPALEALDHIIDQAHTQQQQQAKLAKEDHNQQQQQQSDAVQRGSAVYAAMSRPHYNTLCEAVMTYGTQLLPSLPDITRRVRLAWQLPLLSTVECWQTAGLLSSYYGAGMSGLVAEWVEMGGRAEGLCVLGLPQMQLPASCLALHREEDSAKGQGEHVPHAAAAAANEEQRIWYARAVYKLEALREMLLGASALMPVRALHKLAIRFALEVIEDGILTALGPHAQGAKHASSFAAADTKSSSSKAVTLHWRVPVELHGACVRLLQAFLLLCPAPPSELRVCATRVVRELGADLHHGTVIDEEEEVEPHNTNTTSTPSEGKAKAASTTMVVKRKRSEAMVSVLAARRSLAAAIAELRQTLHLLYNPPTLPVYSPPYISTERVTRRVWQEETMGSHEEKEEGVQRKDVKIAQGTAAASVQVTQPVATPTPTPLPAVPVEKASSHVTIASQPPVPTAEPAAAVKEEIEETITTTTTTATTMAKEVKVSEPAATAAALADDTTTKVTNEAQAATSHVVQHATVEQTVGYEGDEDDEDADFPEIDIED